MDENLIQFAMTRYTAQKRLKALTKTHESAFHYIGVANVTCFYERF